MEVKRCLDSYALIEIYKGNPRFAEFLACPVVVCILTLAQFFNVVLWDQGEDEARRATRVLEPVAAKVNLPVLLRASRFQREHTRRNLSFFGAVGYLYSLEHGCKFVTGDKEFEDFDQVEFRKAS